MTAIRRAVPASWKRRIRRLVGAGSPADQSTLELLRRAGGPLAGALDCTVAANEHGLYCVPRSSAHRPACQAILQGGVWEPDTIAVVSTTEPAGDVVTAGTFFGDLLPAIARSRRPGALVWAFEPNPENHRCAQVTVALNGLPAVRLTEAGLGASAGQATLVTTDESGTPLGGGSHLLEGDAEPAAGAGTTAVVAIDDVVPADRSVAVIQLDVEGFEQQALTGALRTIQRCRPLLVLENVPTAAWFAEHLAPLGYEADGKVHWNTVYRAR